MLFVLEGLCALCNTSQCQLLYKSVRSKHTVKKIFSVRPLGDFSPEVQGRFMNVDNNGSLVHKPFKNNLFYILKHVQSNRFELHSVHTWVHVDSVGHGQMITAMSC